jgi:hypothetical protein
VLERRLRWPFVALSLAFFGTLVYVLVTSPYRILPGEKLKEFPDWAISAMCLVVTAVGAWTAWQVVSLFRGRALAEAGRRSPGRGRVARTRTGGDR